MPVLAAAEDAAVPDDGHRRQAKLLLSGQRDDVLATLDRLERLAERARSVEWRQALTHGDLTPENLIRDGQGKLHLFDWSKLVVGPPEQDLVNFVGERFEFFLTAYVRHCRLTPRLQPDLFAYYRCFLLLLGITDHGSWILLEEAAPEDREEAWRALSQLLPIDRAAMQAEMNSVGETIDRVPQAVSPVE